MINFFKSASLPSPSPTGEQAPEFGAQAVPVSSVQSPAVSGTGVKCEKLRVGYLDDPFNTDNAWKEVELWHIHYTGTECLADKMVLNSIHWRIVTEDVFTKLPSEQAALMQDLTSKLKPTIL